MRTTVKAYKIESKTTSQIASYRKFNSHSYPFNAVDVVLSYSKWRRFSPELKGAKPRISKRTCQHRNQRWSRGKIAQSPIGELGAKLPLRRFSCESTAGRTS